MKATTIIGILGVVLVVGLWLLIFKGFRQPPFSIATMAGCYISSDGTQKVTISNAGTFTFKGGRTLVFAYEDKQGLSFRPETEILAASNGDLALANGQPFILRIDVDRAGFIVPSKESTWMPFRKKSC